jgi:hypothetical protein
MPFKTKKQELWMRINKPKVYKKWVKKYGHHKSLRPKRGGKK